MIGLFLVLGLACFAGVVVSILVDEIGKRVSK